MCFIVRCSLCVEKSFEIFHSMTMRLILWARKARLFELIFVLIGLFLAGHQHGPWRYDGHQDHGQSEGSDGDDSGGGAADQTCRRPRGGPTQHAGRYAGRVHQQGGGGVPGQCARPRPSQLHAVLPSGWAEPRDLSLLLTGNAGKREEVQELPVHADQTGVTQLALPWYLQECEGPGAGPAGECRCVRLYACVCTVRCRMCFV